MSNNKWIGIPFVWGGQTFEGCDCLGLIRLGFEKIYGIDIPPDHYVHDPANWEESGEESLVAFFDAYYQRVTTPAAGDVVCLHFKWHAAHVGRMLDSDRFLNIGVGAPSFVDRLSSYVPARVVAFWRILPD